MNRENKKAHPNKDEHHKLKSSNGKDNTNTPKSQEKNVSCDRFDAQKITHYSDYFILYDNIVRYIRKHANNPSLTIGIYTQLVEDRNKFNRLSRKEYAKYIGVSDNTLKKVIDNLKTLSLIKLGRFKGSKKHRLLITYPQNLRNATQNRRLEDDKSQICDFSGEESKEETEFPPIPKEHLKEHTKEKDISLYIGRENIEEGVWSYVRQQHR